MPSSYGKKPEFALSANSSLCVVGQRGWTPFSVADGTQVLRAEARDGQIVVVRAGTGAGIGRTAAILWSVVLDVGRDGIQFVTAVEQEPNTLPIELKVTYKSRVDALGSGTPVRFQLKDVLAAAAAGDEVVHV